MSWFVFRTDTVERFFPKEKIVKSGNPIREAVSQPASAEKKADEIEDYVNGK